MQDEGRDIRTSDRPSPPSSGAQLQGSCFGFEVRSEVRLRYLREGSGERLEIREIAAKDLPEPGPTVQSWGAIPGKRAATRLHRAETGAYTIKVGNANQYWFDPVARIIGTAPSADDSTREMLMWATPAALALTLRGDLGLHAAAVQVGERALLLAAPSGSGKSSTAGAFHRAGHRLLSEDLSCIHFTASKGPAVLPGPAVLRLRPDSAERLALDGEARDSSRPKRLVEIPRERRGSGEAVPLAGLVFLGIGEQFSLTRVSSTEAVSRLWPLSFFLADGSGREQCFGSLVETVNPVPVWELKRPLVWSELPDLVDRLANEVVD